MLKFIINDKFIKAKFKPKNILLDYKFKFKNKINDEDINNLIINLN